MRVLVVKLGCVKHVLVIGSRGGRVMHAIATRGGGGRRGRGGNHRGFLRLVNEFVVASAVVESVVVKSAVVASDIADASVADPRAVVVAPAVVPPADAAPVAAPAAAAPAAEPASGIARGRKHGHAERCVLWGKQSPFSRLEVIVCLVW